MATPDFNLVPGSLNLNGVVGDDFSVLLDFSNDLTGYTFEAKVLLDNNPYGRYQAITITNTNLSLGRITLSLSDTQTRVIGPISNKKWFISWSLGGDIRTVLSGGFTLNQPWAVTDYSPTTENQTVIIQTPTISIQVIGGVGGAVLWGDIQGDIEDQADLIQYLEDNYQSITAAESDFLQLTQDTTFGYNFKIFGTEYLSSWQKKVMAMDATKILFAGDSTTEGVSIVNPRNIINEIILFNLAQYVRDFTSLNYGVGASTTYQWANETTGMVSVETQIDQAPDLWVIRYGINDAGWSDTHPFPEAVERFRVALRQGLAKIRDQQGDELSVAILLMTPNTAIGGSETLEWKEAINPIVRQAAIDYKCAFIDTYGLWQDPGNPLTDCDYLDNANAGHYHPLDVFNLWIGSTIINTIFPESLRVLYGKNVESNIYAPALADLPSSYLQGESLAFASSTDGWPVNAGLFTAHHTSGAVLQLVFDYATGAVYTRSGVGSSWSYLGEIVRKDSNGNINSTGNYTNDLSFVHTSQSKDRYSWIDSTQPANQKLTDFLQTGGNWFLRFVNDANSAWTNVIEVNRSGITVNSITFGGPVSASNLSGTNTGDQYGGVTSATAGAVLRRNLANTAYEFALFTNIGSGTNLTITPSTSSTNSDLTLQSKGTGLASLLSGNAINSVLVDNDIVLINGITSINGDISATNLTGTNTGDQYGGVTASGANQYLRRNAANSGYEFGVKTDYLTSTPTTGSTVSFNDNPTDQLMRINPAGDLAALTVDLPSNATSVNTQKIIFMCTTNIVLLTITGASTIFNAPVSMNAGDCFQFYKTGSDEWARVIT